MFIIIIHIDNMFASSIFDRLVSISNLINILEILIEHQPYFLKFLIKIINKFVHE